MTEEKLPKIKHWGGNKKKRSVRRKKKKGRKKLKKIKPKKKNERNVKKKVSKKKRDKKKVKKKKENYIKTGVSGLDKLIEKGIPRGSSILIAGGAGSGKTILSLQILNEALKKDQKCFYMSFEESEERLISHMKDFGWDISKFKKEGKVYIKRFGLFDIARSIDALLAESKGELMVDIKTIIIPKKFKPDFIFVDSLSSIASAFVGKTEHYRVYIEQLFRFFESLGATSFLISETTQHPSIFSPTGVEEFLADGVIVLYNLRKENVRENAIEVLKLRGTKHQKRIVAMQILGNVGIEVYPEQEVFTDLEQIK